MIDDDRITQVTELINLNYEEQPDLAGDLGLNPANFNPLEQTSPSPTASPNHTMGNRSESEVLNLH
ncbi:hypothetical protein GYB43_00235 [bacterium]|jgi:hypothetical protein|nr:hypothetical protein [bacterium]